ncbi:uncharacterized protein LOC128731315 [Anopheles nili]|uniref:uncharacterized protein LOC128731315 n=1 Tax=Anopheles nili TaxID=185578 RepID=UPI00237AC662|nr:uncharacterized protein LOC128731315 [Anopheles nili]
MNYLLHRHRSPGAVVPIPPDLEPLMEEMAREVLRAQPPNVIDFLADYLEGRLARRENRRLAEKVVDNVLDYSFDIVAMLESVGIDSNRAEQAVKRIREEFHRHFETKPDDDRIRDEFRERTVLERLVNECHFTEKEARKASRIIERAYRTYYFRNAYKGEHAPAKDSDWRQAAKHTLSLYAQTGPTKHEMEAAARRIQVAYRAYYKRKRQELDRQATIIQRAVRNHQNRQQTAAQLEAVPSEVIRHEILENPAVEEFSPSQEILALVDAAIGFVTVPVVDDRSQDTSPQDLDQAASLIQSVFRGHQVRKQITGGSPHAMDTVVREMDEDQAATVLQSATRGHLARKRVQQELHQHQMATVLQSHARGFLVRKQLQRNAPGDSDDGAPSVNP